MAKFKAGDKVVRTQGAFRDTVKGGIYTVEDVDFECCRLELEGHDGIKYDPGCFELYQEPQQFNLKTDKWWIATPTPEISKAVQEWLFEQGITWCTGDSGGIQEQARFLGNIEPWRHPYEINDGGFTYAKNRFPGDGLDPEYEIKITTKTVIDSVTFPDIISEQEKARKQSIAELEDTIAKAQQQIEQLKGL